jgi:hypothetical protein
MLKQYYDNLEMQIGRRQRRLREPSTTEVPPHPSEVSRTNEAGREKQKRREGREIRQLLEQAPSHIVAYYEWVWAYWALYDAKRAYEDAEKRGAPDLDLETLREKMKEAQRKFDTASSTLSDELKRAGQGLRPAKGGGSIGSNPVRWPKRVAGWPPPKGTRGARAWADAAVPGGEGGLVIVQLENGELLLFKGDDELKKSLQDTWRRAAILSGDTPARVDLKEKNDRTWWYALKTPDGSRRAVISIDESPRRTSVYIFKPGAGTPYFPWQKGFSGAAGPDADRDVLQASANQREMHAYQESYVQGGVSGASNLDASSLHPGPGSRDLRPTWK